MTHRGILLAALVLLLPATVWSADYTWSSVGWDFGDGNSWDPLGVPGPFDRAIFVPGGSTAGILGDSTGDQAVERLLVDQGQGFELELAGWTLSILGRLEGQFGPSVLIGDTAATGSFLAVRHGYVTAKESILARAPLSTGTLDVDGARWSAFRHFFAIGDAGDGHLNVFNGGIVEHGHGWAAGSVGGTGNIYVWGAGSQWYVTGFFALGSRGDGRLRVDQGGLARTGRCVMGEFASAQADAVVAGSGSRWDLLTEFESSLVVGREGAAAVLVQYGGAQVTAPHVVLGELAAGQGNITLTDTGRMNIASSLIVGQSGDGEVNVFDPGSVLAVNYTATGSSATESGVEEPTFVVGQYGTGRLFARNGGRVQSRDGAIGLEAGSSGEATVDDSLWLINDNLGVGGFAAAGGQGALYVQGGGQVSVGGSMTVFETSTLALNGIGGVQATGGVNVKGWVVGHGQLIGDTTIGGSAIPDPAPGLAVNGQATFVFADNGERSNLEIRFAKPGPAVESGLLAVSGDLTGLGTANLILAPQGLSLANLTGQVFTVATCGNDLSGGAEQFAQVIFPGGMGGPVDYLNGAITVQFTLPGDANLDHAVDFADYQRLEVNFGTTSGATWHIGDFNGDHAVDFADYQVLEVNFGQSVPEPGCAALLLIGAIGTFRRRLLR